MRKVMKLTVVLAVLIGILVLACSSAARAPVKPTSDINKTVEARLAHERAVGATVEASLAEEKASDAKPANTPASQASDAPNPEPMDTATLVPTAISVPMPTPRPLPTATPTPAPTPTAVPIPAFEILSKHPTLDCLNTQFQMFIDVFGLYVVAPSSAPEEYVIHSANVLAEYIDNDADGLPDDAAVLEHLQRQNVLVPVWVMSTREQFEQNRRGTECEDGVTLVASMYYDEDQWAIGGIESAGKWDTNLEEIWHIVSIGWYATYPEFFGDEPSESSKLVNAMDAARGGRFFAIPDRYSESAWYAYYDDTCDYGCQLHEYFYWITMANIDALDPVLTSKCADSAHEWNVCSQSELEKVDVLAFDLLNNHGFNLPTNIPNGRYRVN